jgi:hypothetical protein
MIRKCSYDLYKELIRYGTLMDDTEIKDANIRIMIIKDDVTNRIFKIIMKDGEVIQIQKLTEQYSHIEI